MSFFSNFIPGKRKRNKMSENLKSDSTESKYAGEKNGLFGHGGTTTKQPGYVPEPTINSVEDDEANDLDRSVVHFPSFNGIKRKFSTREGWVGDFDYAWLCLPSLPFSFRGKSMVKSAPFYGLYDNLPITIALICGFQHSLAMIAGLITPPIIFANELGLGPEIQNYLVAASLITSGILSAVQMTRWKIPYTNRYFGTGLITVVGTSFATLSTASGIFNTLYENGVCPSTVTDGETVRGPCPQAYGYLLGTACLCSLTEMGMAFVPIRILKRMFPPLITGGVVLLIGASLVGSSGFPNWGGDAGNCFARPTTGIFQLCPTIFAPNAAPWGSAQYLGLGFLSFVTIILTEFFGSPFMKNASIVMGLIMGMIVAGATGYVSGTTISDAPAITFLWVHTFPLKVYGPAILPMMAVYIALAMEAIGDITASSEASRQPVDGKLFDSRISAGILADGFNGLLSGLFTNTPMSIFAQNNGTIVLTRCANRSAGYVCCTLLIIYGVLAKISGIFLAIPSPVLGGVTTFLFASVAVSGLRVLALTKFTRRDRFVMGAAFSLGIGNLLVPQWATFMFTYSGDNSALRGFMDSIVIILSTPFLIYGVVAIILNLLLPADPDTGSETLNITKIVNVPEAEVRRLEEGDRIGTPTEGIHLHEGMLGHAGAHEKMV